MAGDSFIMSSTNNSWVDGVKLATHTVIPDVLPFFKTKLRNTISKTLSNAAGQDFHSCDV